MAVKLYLDPLDTLFFRENRSFTAGADIFARGGLPSPLAVFGAVGACLLESADCTLSDFKSGKRAIPELGGYSDDLNGAGLRLKGPFICWDREPYFPAPANLLSPKDVIKPFLALPELDSEGILSDLGSSLSNRLTAGDRKDLEPLGGYLSRDEIMKYLLKTPMIYGGSSKQEDDFFMRENRVGHLIDQATYTVEEGMLYSTEHLRFQDKVSQLNHQKSSLLIVADTLTEGDIQFKTLYLGGERRAAAVRQVEYRDKLVPEDPVVLKKIKEQRRFLVYLATPAILCGGWTGHWEQKIDEFKGATLAGAAVGKPITIGGWQRSGSGQGGSPRPLLRAVPAGSVYFFIAAGWDDTHFDKIYRGFHFNRSLSDSYPDAGFGIALIGVW